MELDLFSDLQCSEQIEGREEVSEKRGEGSRQQIEFHTISSRLLHTLATQGCHMMSTLSCMLLPGIFSSIQTDDTCHVTDFKFCSIFLHTLQTPLLCSVCLERTTASEWGANEAEGRSNEQVTPRFGSSVVGVGVSWRWRYDSWMVPASSINVSPATPTPTLASSEGSRDSLANPAAPPVRTTG